MTDIKDRFAGMLADEPPGRDDIDHVVGAGRRRLRRRTALISVAGTAGTAAVVAAVVVPLSVEGSSAPNREALITAGSHPSPPPCQSYLARPGSRRALKRDVAGIVKQWHSRGQRVYRLQQSRLTHGLERITVCSGPGDGTTKRPVTATAPASSAPRYHYSEDPQAIASRFGRELSHAVDAAGRTIVYTRPFAQETSTLESGHPSYYDGNVDVALGGDQGDIGVQVTHAVTEQVPFDGSCDPPYCSQTTLPDGSVLQTDRVDAGKGTILTAVIHRPDGLVVAAQESDYGFGPNAPVHTYGAQPLTLDQLTSLAADPAFQF